MSRATHIIQLFEQSWYGDYVNVANDIQKYLLGTGSYMINKEELTNSFLNYPEEAIDRAVQILVANAAMQKVSGTDTYRINYRRLSSARL
jgi:hypothetical protein